MGKGQSLEAESPLEEQKLYLEVLLCQYKSVRDEILSVLKELQDISIYSFVAIAGLTTLVVSLIDRSPHLLATFLIVLPLPFMAILITYLGHLVAAVNLTNFISSQIEAPLEKLISTFCDRGVPIENFIGWDTFVHRKMQYSLRLLHTTLWPIGQGGLICLPILVSLVGFYYIVSSEHLHLDALWQILLGIDTVVLVFCLITGITAIRQIGLLRKIHER